MFRYALMGLLFILVPSFATTAMAASAVAADLVAHKFADCHGQQTVKEANRCAVERCRKGGGRDCRIVASSNSGGRGAVAGGGGYLGTVLGSAEDEETVSARAMWECQQKATGCSHEDVQSGRCKVRSACRILAKWNDSDGAGQGSARPAPQAPASNAAAAAMPSGGYQTCTLPSDKIGGNGGTERAIDPAYARVCLSILPPTCRNWVMNKEPCAYRACVVDANLAHCPGGEPTAYVAKETLPFTKEELAAMNAQIDAEARRIAAQRGGNAAPGADAQYWQTQIQHRQTEFANGNAGGVTYNGR
jgi:hypothetical protein